MYLYYICFYQDNDPKYVTKHLFTYNCSKLLQTAIQAPDLNVIELAGEKLERKFYKSSISTVEQLKQGIK